MPIDCGWPAGRMLGAVLGALPGALLGLTLMLAAPDAARAATGEAHEVVRDRLNMVLQNAIMGRDVAELERMTSEYRATKLRMPNSQWFLQAVYLTIEESCIADARSTEFPSWIDGLLTEWQARHPQSPSPQIVRALCHLRLAEKIRGRGFAEDIWDDAWPRMSAEVEKARRVLVAAKPVSDVDPHWYVAMIRVFMYANVRYGGFSTTMEEAIAREPDYDPVYVAGLLYLLPRWHGSFGQAGRWIQRAAARTSSRQGDGLYAHLAWRIWGMHTEEERTHGFKLDWARIRKGMLDRLDRQPFADFATTDDYMSMSCSMRDREQVLALWKRLQAAERTLRDLDVDARCGWKTVGAEQMPRLPKP